MKKNKKLNSQPTQDEMSDLEHLFKSNQLSKLITKAEKLINKYPYVSNLFNILGFALQEKSDFSKAIFNFEKAYFILDELIMAGEVQDTSKKAVLKQIEFADSYQEEEIISLALKDVGLI